MTVWLPSLWLCGQAVCISEDWTTNSCKMLLYIYKVGILQNIVFIYNFPDEENITIRNIVLLIFFILNC
jgi:hypothetical protein